MATPPPYSEPPPRYSRYADPNPTRYLVNNGHVYQVAEAPGPPHVNPLPQPIPPQQIYNSAPYMQTYPNPQYHPFTTYNYTYPATINNIQPYPIPTALYQQQAVYQPHPRPVAYQSPPQMIPAEPLNYHQQSYVPPPPSEYIVCQGTHFAIPREWMESSSKKKKKRKHRKNKNKCKYMRHLLCALLCGDQR